MLKHLLKIKYNRNIINRSLFFDSRERELERELEKRREYDLERDLEKDLEKDLERNLYEQSKVFNLNKRIDTARNKNIESSIETKLPL